MINVRLLDYVDQKRNVLTPQCGGTAKRTTIEHHLSIEATVMKAEANIEHVASVFLTF